jgi:acetyl-CoA carboxylase carboxyl transferase subunit beta
MVDMVVHRHELRATIARLCRLLLKIAGSAPQSRLPVPSGAMTPAIA